MIAVSRSQLVPDLKAGVKAATARKKTGVKDSLQSRIRELTIPGSQEKTRTTPQKSKANPLPPPSDLILRGPDRWKTLIQPTASFYWNKLKLDSGIDPVTRRWIRNASDERAAKEGYRFSEKLGMTAVRWVEKYCILYEGDESWVGKPLVTEDWQFEFFMQLFGWQGFNTDWNRWVRRFKQAGVWIPKKNGKSPTLAATGLYTLIGDGEKGQKCYSLARDKEQAMIAHRHAIEMVNASEELSDPKICSVNNTTGKITYHPTKSFYYCIAGGDSSNKLGTEGFNGSLFVDETHVVDQGLMKRVKRAGISRSEPLHVEMSTAGDNIGGYGLQRYEWGQAVESMKEGVYDPHFLFMNYSAPDNLSLENSRDPQVILKAGIHCNPAMGRIVHVTEFMEDHNESCRSQTELRQFLMYRLNMWLKASGGWIEPDDWAACKKEYTLEDLLEYPCVAGLDLSKTRDLTALALLFAVPADEADESDAEQAEQWGLSFVPHLWVEHWLPMATVRMYSKRIDFNPWIKAKLLNEEPGKTIRYSQVAKRLEWFNEHCDLRAVGFDPYNSDVLVEILENNYSWPEDKLVVVKQNMQTIGPPTSELERLILQGNIAHNGNPLFDWQLLRNVEMYTDKYGNKRPIKPINGDHRKIDGVVAAIIATYTYFYDESMNFGQDMGFSVLRSEGKKEKETERVVRR